MKKFLAVSLLSLIIASTVVSAQTLSKYKGFDIVNVKVNGNELKLDVPAIIMDGRTLLPLRKVSESMNSIVSWDSTTKTASVLKPQVNIVFFETKDNITAFDQPCEIIPYWTEYDKFLSFLSISNLPAGSYTAVCAIYKSDPSTGLMESTPIDSKPTQIPVSSMNTPVPFSLAWDKSVINGAGVYNFVVKISENDTNSELQTVAVHTMEIR